MMLNYIKRSFFILVFFTLFFNTYVKAKENIKIIYDINEEIITNVDIKNDYKYLLIIDQNFSKIDEKQGLEIAKQNTIKDKIRLLELIKNGLYEVKNDESIEYIDSRILQYFKKLGINGKDEIVSFINNYGLSYDFIYQKFELDLGWKELVTAKYSRKINIDIDKIKKRIAKNELNKTRSFLLSEITFNLKDNENLDQKFQQIKNNILKNGFESSASLYSISNTSKLGGKIGWVEENQLSKDILKYVIKLKINGISDPIKVPSGYLLLKLNNIKEENKSEDQEAELKKIISFEKNRQLSEFSYIYIEKLRINTFINER